MKFFKPFGWHRPTLTAAHQAQLARWQALRPSHLRAPLGALCFVVVDCETTGLDRRRDHVLSIGAVRIHQNTLALSDCFTMTLKHSEPSSRDNILLHGISATEQRAGREPQDALLAWLDFIGKAPLVGFHAAFDRTILRKALRQHLGCSLASPWLDLAQLLPVLFPHDQPLRQLDDWLTYFRITPVLRHHALGDAAATAQLFLMALSAASQHGITDGRGLYKLPAHAHWLSRR
jgi:DNA polymerase III subunit epsilon